MLAESFLAYLANQHGMTVRKLPGFGYVCAFVGSLAAMPLGASPDAAIVKLLCIAAVKSPNVGEA